MFRKPGKEAYVHIEATSLMVNKYKTVIDKYKYEEELKIQFTDKGIGFDNMFKDQVFELFKRLHAQSGLGIGLSLCRKIIQNHHGTISIESWKDEKTIISIWLPINKEAI
jgi:signal transduction histidine kinase